MMLSRPDEENIVSAEVLSTDQDRLSRKLMLNPTDELLVKVTSYRLTVVTKLVK